MWQPCGQNNFALALASSDVSIGTMQSAPLDSNRFQPTCSSRCRSYCNRCCSSTPTYLFSPKSLISFTGSTPACSSRSAVCEVDLLLLYSCLAPCYRLKAISWRTLCSMTFQVPRSLICPETPGMRTHSWLGFGMQSALANTDLLSTSYGTIWLMTVVGLNPNPSVTDLKNFLSCG